jgi:hypothetical protein
MNIYSLFSKLTSIGDGKLHVKKFSLVSTLSVTNFCHWHRTTPVPAGQFVTGIVQSYKNATIGDCETKPVALSLCREGLFILPYNELAVAQGPKIHQKNEL